MTRPAELLAVTGGHRFDRDAFAAMIDAVAARLGWSWQHAEHPQAGALLTAAHAGRFAAIVLYDLPGLSLARGVAPAPIAPPPDVITGIDALVGAGQGIVALHHALAGWPAWDGYAELLGGRFLYAPGTVRGVATPASGYRMDTYRVGVAAPEHPVCAGVAPFEVTDELYGCAVFDDTIEPLLTTDADLSPSSLLDTYREVLAGEQVPWTGAAGSNLVGWSVPGPAGRGRVVYLLPGHGPSTMGNEMYRTLLANACAWVANTTTGTAVAAREDLRP